MADCVSREALELEVDSLESFAQERIIYAADLARAFNSRGQRWDTRRAKRFLKRSGLGFQMGGRADKWVTTSTALAERYPQLWRLFLAREIDKL